MSKRLTKEEIEEIKDHNQRCYGWPDDKDYGNPRMTKLLSHIEAVESEFAEKDREIEKLRKVLKFYTDQGKYGHEDGQCSPICTDGGEKARETLK